MDQNGIVLSIQWRSCAAEALRPHCKVILVDSSACQHGVLMGHEERGVSSRWEVMDCQRDQHESSEAWAIGGCLCHSLLSEKSTVSLLKPRPSGLQVCLCFRSVNDDECVLF